jgi:hypothetical protein
VPASSVLQRYSDGGEVCCCAGVAVTLLFLLTYNRYLPVGICKLKHQEGGNV